MDDIQRETAWVTNLHVPIVGASADVGGRARGQSAESERETASDCVITSSNNK